MERVRRTPALVASALFHAGLLALALIAVKTAPALKLPAEPVSVSIVSGEPNVSPAVQAPEPSPPQAEESAPALALPGPEAPQPAPAPAPSIPKPPPPKPAPTPTPKTEPTPPPPKPAPAKPQPLNLDKLAQALPKPAKPQPSLDLNKLTASLPQKTARPGAGALNLDALADSLPAGRRAGAGARGPARPEAAAQARQATGAATSLSGSELGALQAKLKRLWTPNCGLEGVQSIVIRVSFGLGPDGSITSPPRAVSKSGDVDADVLNVAAARAVSAVNRGAPFDELSPETLRAFGTRTVVFSKPCT